MLIDWSRIEILDDPDEPDWLKGIIKDLVIDIDTKILEISSLIEKNEADKLRALLHQMKGVSGNFGFMQFHEICLNSETFLKEGKHSSGYSRAKDLFEIWKSTKAELNKKFNF